MRLRTLREPVSILALSLIASCATGPVDVDREDSSRARALAVEAKRYIAAREYHASENRRGLQAPNRAHGLRTYFEPGGIRVVDRTAAGAPELLRLSLEGWGRGDAWVEATPGEVTHRAGRVEVDRGAIVEWFENGPAGLEQGFTIAERPAGQGPLRLDLAASGVTVSGSGQDLVFTSDGGRRLRFRNLLAIDARARQVSARFEPDVSGFQIVVEDAAAIYPLVVDPLLTSSDDALLESDQVDAQFGSTVASAGDVNGDGYADVVATARLYDSGEADEGAAFVFHGGPGGVGDGGPLDADAVIESDQTDAQLSDAASAGDVNGDGYDDLIVGINLYDAGDVDEGAAFVFHGSASGISGTDPASSDAQLESNLGSSSLGTSVAPAGDVDGDGYADVIVGAPLFANGHANEGGAFVFHGSASGITGTDPTNADAQIEANQTSAFLGGVVAAAGDVNGDGFGDIIVGAPFYDAGSNDEGAAFVFHGSASGITGTSPLSADATLESDEADAWMGTDVGAAGDVNGDGYGDVIVASRRYDIAPGLEGAAFVFHGSASGVGNGNPASADTQLDPDPSDTGFAFSASSAGDVNGDGYADLLVGSYLSNAPEPDEGLAYVFLGSATGVSDGTSADAFAAVESDDGGALLGFSVASAGDVNGDGFADVIVGAPLYSNGHSEEGAAFLYHGGAEGIEDGDPSTADATIESNQPSSASVGVATTAGDVNGDGYDDLIVSSSGYDAGEANEGAAFVFLGGAAGIANANPGTADAQLESNQAGARFGTSAASAGDVNGDGYADVIVGSPFYDGDGAAFVFLGSSTGIASANPGTAHAQLDSAQTSSHFGASVASAGDVDGDGYADVIVGAPSYDDGESEEGSAFVFLGGASGIASGDVSTAHAQIESDEANAFLGSSVASAGDVDGDGHADIVVGAPRYDINFVGSNGGVALVFHGSASGISGGNPAAADALLESDQTDAEFGGQVASAGDVNGDGFADVIVGAAQYDNDILFESDAGGAFVFHGSASGVGHGTAATADTTLLSDASSTSEGGGVAGAGDVNGDGYADVIVGAPRYTVTQFLEGAAFLYLGGTGGIPDGDPTTADTTLLGGGQFEAAFGSSVAPAGDVNGDGFADVIVGARDYDNGETDEGAAFVFEGNFGGKPVRADQLRGDGSDTPVVAWGGSQSAGSFEVSLDAASPRGRERARLEVEACPAGVAFGDVSCTTAISSAWFDLGTTGASITESVSGLGEDTLYHWRARVQYAPIGVTEPGIASPPNPRVGPWRRHTAQAVEADVRVLPEPAALAGFVFGAALIAAFSKRRRATQPNSRD